MEETHNVQTEQALGKGLTFKRIFSKEDGSPFSALTFDKRTSIIAEPDGKIVFEMQNVEVPEQWSQLATDIIASKYFRKRGVPGEPGHEISAQQVVFRIANTIREFGEEKGYFASKEDAEAYEMELTYILINQHGAFNSPVWFNCGLFHKYGVKGGSGNWCWDFDHKEIHMIDHNYERPQCSACFIQSAEDDLMKIYELLKAEARLFKYGSGTGSNFSKIRGRQEKLSGGGTSSGLMSFLEVFDRAAGATKSGGTTRRAAKMVCLDMDHPEIIEFINWKVKEEKKAKVLMEAGYAATIDGEAYKTVSGQNSNNSVRITDTFMNAVLENKKWRTTMRTTGEVVDEFNAREIMNQICEAAWVCADPGVQFDTSINNWHTCPGSDKIHSSNPCSEYMFLDDSACNLASINLMKYVDEEGNFNIEAFKHTVRVFITAMEILVDFSSYPTKSIAQNSHDYRPLGLGYANLGTLLMINGIPYDSEKGRAIAGAITAIMCGHAYTTSAEMASSKGTFNGFEKNREPMLRVMNKHRDAAYKIDVRYCPEGLLNAARECWDVAVNLGERQGYRNAQTTVIAPTGTIGLLMDCDTTGVEPEFSLVKWKKLAGGGYFKIINKSIERALKKLGKTEEQLKDIINYILGSGSLENAPHINPEELKKLGFTDEEIKESEKHIVKLKGMDDWTPHVNPKSLAAKGLSKEQIKESSIFIGGAQTIEGAPHVTEEEYAVFDCANKCGIGKRFIEPMGHVKMMAAVQPFISGAISKTVNIPNDATVKEIEKIYIESWKLGLKAIALYRDGCKLVQALNTSTSEEETEEAEKTDKVEEAEETEKTEETKKEEPISMVQEERKLESVRTGVTVETNVAGHTVAFRTSNFTDGSLAELNIDMHKQGSAYNSMMTAFSKAVTLGLRHGVPLQQFVDNFTFTRFEPQGMTSHPNVKTCTSVVDFIFRVLGMEYLGKTDFVHVKPSHALQKDKGGESISAPASTTSATPTAEPKVDIEQPITAEGIGSEEKDQSSQSLNEASALSNQLEQMMGDAPPCNTCGNITVRNGSCYRCLSCGNSMGCS